MVQVKLFKYNHRFNYCQYPCAFTLISKQRIIKHEQQSEMISNAKDELETQLRRFFNAIYSVKLS